MLSAGSTKGAGVRTPSLQISEKATQNGYSKNQIDFFIKIANDFPDFKISFGQKFSFRPPKSIMIGPVEPGAELLTLHELGHAVSSHRDFKMGAERLRMELEAWEKARDFAKEYAIDFDEDLMERELDTYRDWLHQKSRCPRCGLTRFQTPDSQYHCPRCESF